MKYVINEGTRMLHIVGYCYYTKYMGNGIKTYSSEMKAVEDFDRNITMCKICSRRRDDGYKPTNT